ncbi:MAG TPA: glycoside hydrolase family 3 C-terminal domain-containing protein [Phycisphaerae bacterium]|nr:glycoside hydrolase family 3 C-terminal domain-containing protein [Phycisphaerae bacterium]
MTDAHHAAIPGIVNRRDFLTLAAATAILTMGGRPSNAQDASAAAAPPSIKPTPVGNISPENFLAARRRATELAAKMPLQEKVGQLGIAQAAAPSIGLKAFPLDPPDATPAQRTSPIDFHEALHGLNIPEPSTSFPVPMALSHAWDPDLMHRVYTAISDEAWAAHKKYNGVLVFHSPPTLNLGQEPRWGRVQETLSEDPFLASTLGMEMIRGMQGTDIKYLKTVPCSKHFICNNSEHDRLYVTANPDLRSFHEYYLPPFHACIVHAGSFSVLAAYNALFNVPCSASTLLLTDILRNAWGFQGFVVSDRRAIIGIKTFHRYRGTFPQAAATALQAGIDVDGWYVLQQYTIPALEQNLITEADIDRALINYLTGLVLLGIFDGPNASPYSSIPEEVLDSSEHRALALETARRSLVLLKNQNNILPLDLSKLKTITIIGPTAATCELGGYSGVPKVQISPLLGIAAAFGIDASGVKPDKTTAADLTGSDGRKIIYRQGCTASGFDNSLFQQALDAAAAADVVIFVAGADQTIDHEGQDRTEISLPGLQHELIRAIFNANPQTVLVLNSNAPVAVNWEQKNLPAIVAAICAGQAQGTAISDVLTGAYNPSGKLTCTWYRSADDLPDYRDYDIKNGRTYLYFQKDPLYPFGYGLSYATFEYSDLKFSSDAFGPENPMMVSLTVKNTGDRDGTEIVQLYVTAPAWPVQQPDKQLVAFEHVDLKAGQSAQVNLTFDKDALALRYYDENTHKDIRVAGTVKVLVGASSTDIRLTGQVELKIA